MNRLKKGLAALFAVALMSMLMAVPAFAEESYTIHISCSGIEESVLESHMDSNNYMYDGQELSEFDNIPQFCIKNYYGDDGLINSYPIERFSINGKEFAIPEPEQQTSVKIIGSELSGIGIDDEGGYIEIYRSVNDLRLGFSYATTDIFGDEIMGSAYLLGDLTIEVVFKSSHTHSLDKVSEAPATCTEPGAEAYWKCTDPTCGKMFSDEAGTTEITAPATIPAKGHSLKKTEAKAASYTAAGNKEYYTCSSCGKFFGDAEGKAEIAKDSWVIAKLAKKAQPMKASAKKVAVKSDEINKKAKTVAAVSVSGAQGKVSYKIAKITTKKKLAKQAKKKIKLAKNGKLKLKKGLKQGTYKVKVKVAAAGTEEYEAGSKTVTVKVKVNAK